MSGKALNLKSESIDSIKHVRKLMCSELHGPAVFKVFDFREEKIKDRFIYPEIYFLAAGEMLSFMIVLSWIISGILQPDSPLDKDKTVFEDNALKRRIGYNNLCVAFDVPPARYLAAFIYMFIAYCGIRYAWLDLQRTQMTDTKKSGFTYYFSIITDLLYIFAWALFTLTFVIPPDQDVWGHSIGFMTLGTTTWLVLLANAIEYDDCPTIVWIFVFIYGVFTITDFGLAGINFVYYQQTGGGPWNPWWIGWVADYGWFGSMAMTSAIMPRGEPLKITTIAMDAPEYGKDIFSHRAPLLNAGT